MHRFPIMATALTVVLAATTACDERQAQAPTSANWQRVDAAGHIMMPDSGEPHRCVLDPGTGLMWQVHGETAGLHDAANRYSWYSTDKQRHMSEPGRADGGQCQGSPCDTQALVEAVNREQLCGHSDWRLPDREELFSLADERLLESGLMVDTAFFPGAVPEEYWTQGTFRLYPESAWAVNFGNGLDRADYKTEAKSVRLVRRHAGPTEIE